MERGFSMERDVRTERIISAALAVHRALGPGLLESAYQTCMAHELAARGIHFEREKPISVTYKGTRLDCGYRVDMLVEQDIILELKSVERIDRIHVAQVLTYLKLSNRHVGLLINFNVHLLKDGIRRLLLGPPPPPLPL